MLCNMRAHRCFPSPRLTEIVRKLSASGLMALPSGEDFAGAVWADLNMHDQSNLLDAETRTGIKLAFDASVTGFAGRQDLYEYYFQGDPARMAGAVVSGYDLEPARQRVRHLSDH